MTEYEEFLYDELVTEYSKSDLCEDDYNELFMRFCSLSHLIEVRPYLFVMRFLGLGTQSDKKAVLEELRSLQPVDNPAFVGLYYDLLLFENGADNDLFEKLCDAEKSGYSDRYLKEQSHLHSSSLLEDIHDVKLREYIKTAIDNQCADYVVRSGDDGLAFGEYFSIDFGYAAYPMIHNDIMNYAEFYNARVLVTCEPILLLKDLLPLLEQLAQNKGKERIVIFTTGVSEAILDTISVNIDRGSFPKNICLVDTKGDSDSINSISKLINNTKYTVSQLQSCHLSELPELSHIFVFAKRTYVEIRDTIVLSTQGIKKLAVIKVKNEARKIEYENIINSLSSNQEHEKTTITALIDKIPKEKVLISTGVFTESVCGVLPACVSYARIVSSPEFLADSIELKGAYVLISRDRIEKIESILPILEEFAKYKARLILLAESFSDEVTSVLDLNNRKGTIYCYAYSYIILFLNKKLT